MPKYRPPKPGQVLNLEARKSFAMLDAWYRQHEVLTDRYGIAPDGTVYGPSPKQLAFHKSTHHRRLVVAGNQVGKTHCGAKEAWYYALGRHPYKDVPPAPNVGLVVGANHRALMRVVGQKLFETVPDENVIHPDSEYNYDRGWKNGIIKLNNGSLIIFASSEGKTTSVAGYTLDWVWVDEPPMRHQFSEITSRLAVKSADLWMTFTPVGAELTWLKHLVDGDPDLDLPPAMDWEKFKITVSKADCPHRSDLSIQRQIDGYLKAEIPQRVFGEWAGPAADRWLDAFDSASEEDGGNVTDKLPQGRYLEGLGIDHGERANKEAAVYVLWDKHRKRVHVADEWISTQVSTAEEDAIGILQMLQSNGTTPQNLDRAIGDINTGGKQAKGTRINDLIGDVLNIKIRIPAKGAGSILWGTRLMNMAFKDHILTVSPKCKHLIKCLNAWDGDKHSDNKDIIDALRYVVTPILQDIYRGTPSYDRLKLLHPGQGSSQSLI